jgi:NADPH-dependent 7-cyano-7-deazaguanine reductase QueF-like protein
MTLKECPGCKIKQTTRNAQKHGRDVWALYFNCRFCLSTFVLRSKNWKIQLNSFTDK